MRLVSRLIGKDVEEKDDQVDARNGYSELADGALDTLGSLVRVFGDDSFPLDQEADTVLFAGKCGQIATHIENGEPAPAVEIRQSSAGTRHWSQVRGFLVDRRRAEKIFVTERLNSYRTLVEDLVLGLRQIGERDQVTENRVVDDLEKLENTVNTGNLQDIQSVLAATVEQITNTFAEQKQEYESQLLELNSRMSNLRQDLMAAREEMKRDALTDAFNRGAFDTAIEQSVNLHAILDQPVTLVMVDLDNFKQVNDGYGHAAGDKVLRAVSECLERSFIRKGDLVARYGGDEFAVILNDTMAKDSTKLVERFLQLVSSIQIDESTPELSISCSAGYTELRDDDQIETLIERADRALYEAKAAGRNKATLI
ncbi:MAG: diguanylate cyclase [Woeseiaceae bacterium]